MRLIVLSVAVGGFAALLLGRLLARLRVRGGLWLIGSGDLALRLVVALVFARLAVIAVGKGGAWIALAVGAAILALLTLAMGAVRFIAVVKYGVRRGNDSA